jgi:hypothetical protein
MSGGSLRSLLMKRSNSIDCRRVDLGHAEAVADRRVGSRAASLAQALLARELHDVVDGQEIRLVLQVRDQLQLVFDLRLDVDRDAAGKRRRAPM